MAENRKRKILVIRFNAIGDVLNATPSIRLIKQAYPESSIDFLVGRWAEPAIRNNPHVNEIITVENDWFLRLGFSSLINILSTLRILRKKRYDAVLAFQKSRAVRLLLFLIGAKWRAMFSDIPVHRLISVAVDEKAHVIENDLILTKKLLEEMNPIENKNSRAFLIRDYRMEWATSEEEEKEAQKVLQQYGVQDNQILIAVIPGGANNPMKNEASVRQWGADKYKELISHLVLIPFARVFLFGGKQDVDVGDYLSRRADHDIINLSDRVSLRVFAAVLGRFKLVITNDTGPMHIAGALGVPLLAVFGPTGAREKLPQGNKFFAVQSSMHCSPCYYTVFKKCLYSRIRCMEEIGVEEVFETAKMILQLSHAETTYESVENNIRVR